MRHTPLDGPDSGDRQTTIQAARPGEGQSDGVIRRVRRVFGLVRTVVAGLLGTPADTDRNKQSGRPTPESTSIVPEDSGRPPAKPVVVEGTGDTRGHEAANGGPRNQPELVARWHEGALTLSDPDEAGGQITSDVWIEIEP